MIAQKRLEPDTMLPFWECADPNENCEESVALTLGVAHKGAGPIADRILKQKTYSEFFAGIGLMRMGLQRKGWSVAFANDIDQQKYEMYKGNFSDADSHYYVGDIHKIPLDKVPITTLATASFPCNDLSLAGARAGLRGKQSSAFWGFIRILKNMGVSQAADNSCRKRAWFPLITERSRDFADALLALNELGYSVDALMLDAADFVPQSRRRLVHCWNTGTRCAARITSRARLRRKCDQAEGPGRVHVLSPRN